MRWGTYTFLGTGGHPEGGREGVGLIKIKSIKKGSATLLVDKYVIEMRVDGDGGKFLIYDMENRTPLSYFEMSGAVDCVSNPIIVGNYEICGALKDLLENYDKYMLLHSVERKLLSENSTVDPSNDDKFLTDVANELIRVYHIKSAVIDPGDGFKVRGIFCFNGIYYNCEDEIHELVRNIGINIIDKVTDRFYKNLKERIRTLSPAIHKQKHGAILLGRRVLLWHRFIESGDLNSSLVDPSPDVFVEYSIPHNIEPQSIFLRREGILRYIPPESPDDILAVFQILAPKSYKAFYDWMNVNDEEKTRRRVLLLLEIIGYTMVPDGQPLQKAFILIGRGSNGKSTYLQLIEKILGSRNVASVSLTELAENRFATSMIYKKLANLVFEEERGKVPLALFKSIIGNDRIKIEEKYKKGFSDRIGAKFIISTNELPKFSIEIDQYAFWRRWIVIQFTNTFKVDPFFFERTFTNDEIEGVIISSLYAIRRALIHHSFTYDDTDLRDIWIRHAVPYIYAIQKLADDGIIMFSSDCFIVKEDMFKLYSVYLDRLEDDEGIEGARRYKSKNHLTRALANFGVVQTRKRVAESRKYVYDGVCIKDREGAEMLIGDLETPRILEVEGDDSDA